MSEVGRIDPHHGRAKGTHAATHGRGRVSQHSSVLGVRRPLRRRRQLHRKTREFLHGTVVQIAGDAPPLAIRCLDRALHQPLPLVLGGADASRECPGQGDLQQRQGEERDHEDRRERGRELPPSLGDAGSQLVRLEQQRRSVRRADRRVHLQEFAVLPLEPVLRSTQIGHLGGDAAMIQHLEVLGTERVGVPDQTRVIGIHDRAVAGPDLHADDGIVQDGVADYPRHRTSGEGVPGHEAVRDAAFHDARGDIRQLAGLVQSLLRGEPADHHDARDGHDHENQQPQQRERQQRANERVWALHVSDGTCGRPRKSGRHTITLTRRCARCLDAPTSPWPCLARPSASRDDPARSRRTSARRPRSPRGTGRFGVKTCRNLNPRGLAG